MLEEGKGKGRVFATFTVPHTFHVCTLFFWDELPLLEGASTCYWTRQLDNPHSQCESDYILMSLFLLTHLDLKLSQQVWFGIMHSKQQALCHRNVVVLPMLICWGAWPSWLCLHSNVVPLQVGIPHILHPVFSKCLLSLTNLHPPTTFEPPHRLSNGSSHPRRTPDSDRDEGKWVLFTQHVTICGFNTHTYRISPHPLWGSPPPPKKTPTINLRSYLILEWRYVLHLPPWTPSQRETQTPWWLIRCHHISKTRISS